MTRRLLPLLLASLLPAGAARADGYVESSRYLPTLVSVSWETVIPQGDLRSFVDRTSFRGLQVELGFGLARHFSLGISASWNWLAQNVATGSLEFPDAVITGAAYHRVELVGLRGTFHWYLTDGPMQPWLGVGLGGGWSESYLAVADQVRTAGRWYGAAEPRAGLLWTIRPGMGVGLQARYVFTTAEIGDVKDARWLALDLGLALY
ncbi:MAG TPA: hypothetical protein VFR85_01700 [Anaeromyxobacteraceae bacterium]|nr:hypothetical protein [Anaeromyxobacteraceae bacterium]